MTESAHLLPYLLTALSSPAAAVRFAALQTTQSAAATALKGGAPSVAGDDGAAVLAAEHLHAFLASVVAAGPAIRADPEAAIDLVRDTLSAVAADAVSAAPPATPAKASGRRSGRRKAEESEPIG